MQKEVIVASGVRTAIGDFGGALATVSPTELGATVIREVLSRAHVEGEEVGHVVFGNVIHTEPKDMYLARVAALEGGVGTDVEPPVRLGPAGDHFGRAGNLAWRY